MDDNQNQGTPVDPNQGGGQQPVTPPTDQGVPEPTPVTPEETPVAPTEQPGMGGDQGGENPAGGVPAM